MTTRRVRSVRARGLRLGLGASMVSVAIAAALLSPSANAVTRSKTARTTSKKKAVTTKKTTATTVATTIPVIDTTPTTPTSTPTTPTSTPATLVPTVAGSTGSAAVPGGPAQDKLVLSDCGTGVQCGTVLVPLDPANPSGAKIGMFVSRHAATNPAQRIGTLFVNPGGPGGPAFDLVRSASAFLTPEMLARFDVIGVDPRGTERSAPLNCSLSALATTDLVEPADNSSVERLRASYINLGKACLATDGSRLVYMDTTTAARDIDAIRVALGEDKISFLGMSYGTYLGAVYESLFPEHTRAVVLDSAIDPARFGINQILDPIIQDEASLDGFLNACATGALTPCAFNDGTDLKAKYNNLRQSYLTSSRNLARAEASFDGTIESLVGYPRNGWPILGRALQEMASGQPGNFSATAADNLSRDNREQVVPQDTFSVATNIAIECRDGILPRDPNAYQTILDQLGTVAPRFTGLRFNAAVATTCTQWPAPQATLTPMRPNAASTLVIGNNFDPTTPIAWSRGLAAELNAPLLVRNGGGHVAVDKSACVQEAVARFFIDGTVPAAGTVCSPDTANPT